MAKKRKSKTWDPDVWFQRCAWCHNDIPEDHEVFGQGVKFRPGEERKDWEGTLQPLTLVTADKVIPMMVCAKDSPGRRDGNDAYFMVCSETCGESLNAALRSDMELGRLLAPGQN